MVEIWEWGAAIIVLVGLAGLFFTFNDDPDFGYEVGALIGLVAFLWPVVVVVGPIALGVWLLGDDEPKPKAVKPPKPPRPVKPKYPDLPDLRSAYPPTAVFTAP